MSTIIATSLPPEYPFEDMGKLISNRSKKMTVPKFDLTQTEDSRYLPLQKTDDYLAAMNDEGVSTLIVENEYGTMKVSLVSTKEEVRRVVGMYKKAMTFFASFGSIGVMAFSSFVSLGIYGVISPFVSIFGALFTGILTAGLFVDFKKWERDYV